MTDDSHLRAIVIEDLLSEPPVTDDLDTDAILSGAIPTSVSTGRARDAVGATKLALSALPNIATATHVLLSIRGGEGSPPIEALRVNDVVEEAARDDANISFAFMIDTDLNDEYQITLIAATCRSVASVWSTRPSRSVASAWSTRPSRSSRAPCRLPGIDRAHIAHVAHGEPERLSDCRWVAIALAIPLGARRLSAARRCLLRRRCLRGEIRRRG